MTLQDLIDLAKKNNLSFDAEIVIADIDNKSIDNVYVDNGKIVVENYGW